MNINSITFGAKISSIPRLKKVSGTKTALSDLNLEGYKAFIGCDVFTPACKIAKHDLLFKDNKLIAIDDFDENSISDKINYAILKDKTVAPAILDEHIHGGYGVSFHDSSEEEIRTLLKRLGKEGTGAVIATTLPGSAEHIKKQLKILNNIIKNPDKGAARIFGIHLEGPFLNPEKKGIHSEDDLMPPTIENYESFEPENVKIVTLAPELDKDFQLTNYLRDKGVIVSAGHSMASAQEILDSGIKQVTHIFNAMASMHHRKPTIANEGLFNPEITAELLADEASVSPQYMNMTFLYKPENKIVLISDALSNAGIHKDFYMNGKLIHVDKNWIPKDDNDTLAGNMKFLHNVAKLLIRNTNMTFQNFIRYACVNPANNLGLLSKFSLREGLEPMISIWDNKELVPQKTFIG